MYHSYCFKRLFHISSKNINKKINKINELENKYLTEQAILHSRYDPKGEYTTISFNNKLPKYLYYIYKNSNKNILIESCSTTKKEIKSKIKNLKISDCQILKYKLEE